MYVTFYLGTIFYVVGAVLALRYIRSANEQALRMAGWMLVLGVASFVGAFILRWMTWGYLPLTTMADSLDLLGILSALVMLFVVRKSRMPALLCFYLPPLAVICAVNAVVARQYFQHAPRALNSAMLTIHVGLAFLAYALFFVASMTSAAYLFQAGRLKNHKTSGLFRHLPSLEELDEALFRLMRYGYPFFVATLFLGLVWAWIDRDLLGTWWWLAPKVILSYVMAAFYAVTFHMRRLGRLRGPKLAHLVFWGFFVLIMTYIVLSILNLRGYHFWSAAS